MRYYLDILESKKAEFKPKSRPRNILNDAISAVKNIIFNIFSVIPNQEAEKMVFEARGLIPRYLVEKMVTL